MTMDAVVDFMRSIWGLWLMMLFLGIVVWAYRPKNKQAFEEAAEIPLNDDLPENDKGKGVDHG